MKYKVFLFFWAIAGYMPLCLGQVSAGAAGKPDTAGISDILRQIQSNMIKVEGGTYVMGSRTAGHEVEDDQVEKPAHQVTVSGFSICKYDVTVREFEAFIKETGYKTEAEKMGFSALKGDNNQVRKIGLNWRCDGSGSLLKEADKNQPVVFLSWNDAVDFCKWVSTKTGKKYRLPTQAEWEYAARGGAQSKNYKYAGSDSLELVGWSGDNSKGSIHAVGLKLPNELGLYDMSGLVYQWCSDWDFSLYYSISPKENPKGPDKGSYRVLRGGAWNRSEGVFHRISLKHSRHPEMSNCNCGLRLVMES